MSSTIGFASTPPSQDIMFQRRSPLMSTLRYTTKDGLPGSATMDQMFYTTDTNQFFRGAGTGHPLVTFSDIEAMDARAGLPEKGTVHKLYVIRQTHELCFYDENGYYNLLQHEHPELEKIADKNQPNGYAGLDEAGKVPKEILPAIAATWEELQNKPLVFPPAPHTHTREELAETVGVEDLVNATITDLDDGQILQYNKTNAQWENQPATYTHVQIAPCEVWMINHNLNRYPSVTVVDSAGTVVVGDIKYIDTYNVQVSFNGGFAGRAYLN